MLTASQVEALVRGEPVILAGDRVVECRYRLDRRQRAEFERAKSNGYIVDVTRLHRLGSLWWSWCESVNQPWIVVQPGPRLARVKMDFLVTGKYLPGPVAEELFARAQREFAGWRGFVGDILVHARLPRSRGEEFARLLAWAARQAIPLPLHPQIGPSASRTSTAGRPS
jgi:hypothetical protein